MEPSLAGQVTARFLLLLTPCLPIPPLPWRNRVKFYPPTTPRLSCILLQPFQHRISWRILPIPPAPAVFDEFRIDVGSIPQEYVSKGAPILVLVVRLERDFIAEGEGRGGVLVVVSYTTHWSLWVHHVSSKTLVTAISQAEPEGMRASTFSTDTSGKCSVSI